jgi:hypothetical protein
MYQSNWNRGQNNQNPPPPPPPPEPVQSATDYFQEMVDKVMKGLPEKSEKSLEYWLGRVNGKKCAIHKEKMSKSCRLVTLLSPGPHPRLDRVFPHLFSPLFLSNDQILQGVAQRDRAVQAERPERGRREALQDAEALPFRA